MLEDVFTTAGAKHAPVFINLHNGAWVGGDKTGGLLDVRPQLRSFFLPRRCVVVTTVDEQRQAEAADQEHKKANPCRDRGAWRAASSHALAPLAGRIFGDGGTHSARSASGTGRVASRIQRFRFMPDDEDTPRNDARGQGKPRRGKR